MKDRYNAEEINLKYNMRNTEKLARVSSFVGAKAEQTSIDM